MTTGAGSELTDDSAAADSDPILGSPVGAAVEALAEALDLAEGRLPDDSVALGTSVVDRVRERARHGTESTLVALLGATGGGKSSLTNAVVGSDVATTGVRRPTTSSTLACYWGDHDPHPLLDWLGVANRHRVGTRPDLDGLVLLDVPDHDSVEVTHRLEMERIAEHADLLVWVTDPEKYGDEAMHAYLRQLRHHGAVTALVLNKADQLSTDDVERCRGDLARLLAEDGLAETPVLVTTAIAPEGEGGGTGVEDLIELLADTVAQRRAAIERLSADLEATASTLLADVGPDGGPDTVPGTVARTLIEDLVGASGLDEVTRAVEAGHRRDAALATGWPFTRWLRSLRPHPLRRLHLGTMSGGRSSRPAPSGVQVSRAAGAIRDAVATVTADLAHPWPELVRAAATPDAGELNDRLDQAIARSVRPDERRPRWWRLVGLLQWVLAAATVAGLVWLGLLALAAYLQLPEIPTPTYRRIPIPTGLVVGGIVLGLLVAAVARRVASIGARRRRRAVGRAAGEAIGDTVDELIVDPMNAELARRRELQSLLQAAGGQLGDLSPDPPSRARRRAHAQSGERG